LLAVLSIGEARDLVVVQVVPNSGSAASMARDYAEGARLYFDRINAQGGIAGARIAFQTHDEPNESENAARLELVLDNARPVVVMGAVGAERIKQLLPSLERRQIPLLGPIINADESPAIDSRYVFYTEPDSVVEIDTLLDKIYGLGLRNVAVCVSRDAARAYWPSSSVVARSERQQIGRAHV